MDYTATVDVKTSLTIDDILEKLEPYEGTLGASKDGYRAIFSYPADSLDQAIATAKNTAESFGESYALSVAPSHLIDEQTTYGELEPLVSVAQAADLLHITPQAVNHRLKNKTLPGAKVGHTWVLPLAAVLAQSIDSE